MTADSMRQMHSEQMRVVAVFREQIAGLNAKLGPFRMRHRFVRMAIKATHQSVKIPDTISPRKDPQDDTAVVKWQRADRSHLFAELDRLAVKFGPVKEQLRAAALELKIAEHNLKAIEKQMKSP